MIFYGRNKCFNCIALILIIMNNFVVNYLIPSWYMKFYISRSYRRNSTPEDDHIAVLNMEGTKLDK